jgi:hypothetical protein
LPVQKIHTGELSGRGQIPDEIIISTHLNRAVEFQSRLAGVGIETPGQGAVVIEGQDLLGKILGLFGLG